MIDISDIEWLSFKDCDLSDEGLRVLTPYLGSLRLQVLGLESCELTDQAMPYVASIIKVSTRL